MIPWWVLVVWALSLGAAFFAGAGSYHGIRVLIARSPLYRPVVPQKEMLKRLAALQAEEKALRDAQSKYFTEMAPPKSREEEELDLTPKRS